MLTNGTLRQRSRIDEIKTLWAGSRLGCGKLLVHDIYRLAYASFTVVPDSSLPVGADDVGEVGDGIEGEGGSKG